MLLANMYIEVAHIIILLDCRLRCLFGIAEGGLGWCYCVVGADSKSYRAFDLLGIRARSEQGKLCDNTRWNREGWLELIGY